MLMSVDKVGGSKKGQKHADVILEWSLISLGLIAAGLLNRTDCCCAF